MPKLKFLNKTEENILRTPLLFCFFDSPDELTGLQREILKGERNISRTEANQYGSLCDDGTPIEFALAKETGEAFSQDEQRVINRWLTSSQFPNDLEFNPGQPLSTIYRGTFSDVRWKIAAPGIIGAICEFTLTSPFAWKTYEQTLSSGANKITVDTDETEIYVYPTFTLTSSATQSVSITNKTDENKGITFKAYRNLPITFDCRNCIVTDATSTGVINYEDLGWTDVGNVCWLRLLPGENEVIIPSGCTVSMKYSCAHKIIGGWIYD